jgi:hypothetical protein
VASLSEHFVPETVVQVTAAALANMVKQASATTCGAGGRPVPASIPRRWLAADSDSTDAGAQAQTQRSRWNQRVTISELPLPVAFSTRESETDKYFGYAGWNVEAAVLKHCLLRGPAGSREPP